ncbi:MAG: branched-chain amino acid aminotransferase [Lunatimonas sp.]|uniref:branched-chain amino acid aminotransferase n=1 Tax=Lunatimonas sp. TaxID=2060141 RepID=UPI00263B97A4|nr:branched-chain amino acid aminotransferase [Lunatimonas sp.]MCC5936909.1 branched-chain amino acid aminotransferase [Lunatimonas sp.]
MQPTPISKPDFDFKNFTFGVQATDHMLTAIYRDGMWQEYEILPFGNLSISPLAMALHYGQTVFEGLKAYRMENGAIHIFRLSDHHDRINRSLYRMAMPALPKGLFMEGMEALIRTEESWIIDDPDYSLYIRPCVIATEARLGVDASEEYLFMILLSPMRSYYSKNLKVKVETDFIRAAKGGTGAAKNGGNYGASLLPQRLAKEAGYDQIIWLDAAERRFIEESGTMNLMVILDGVSLITPPAGETVLEGITRDSILRLAPSIGLSVNERRIEVSELMQWIEAGRNVEVFGVGTAAVISPIESIDYRGTVAYPSTQPDSKMFKLKALLQSIRRGTTSDSFGWNHIL